MVARLSRSSESDATILPLRKDICCVRVRRVTWELGGRRRGEPRGMKVGMMMLVMIVGG